MMIVEYERKSRFPFWIGFLGALVFRLFAVMFSSALPELASLWDFMVLVSLGLFTWGCMLHCKAKGYPPALGLLGLIWLIGLIVLAVLPDKHKSGVQQVTTTAPPPPPYAPTVQAPVESEQQTPQA